MRMRRYPTRAITQIIPHLRPLVTWYDLLVVHICSSASLLMYTQAFSTVTICKLRAIHFRLCANIRLWSTVTTSFCVWPTITAESRVWYCFVFQCSSNPRIWSKCIWSATGCTHFRPVGIWCSSAFATSKCFRTIYTWAINSC